MTLDQLVERHFRLQQELEIAYAQKPWQEARVDCLANDLSAVEHSIAERHRGAMKQIRVAWIAGIHSTTEQGVVAHEGGPWIADTLQNREDVAALVAAGNEVCGPRTHWIEQRESIFATISLQALQVGSSQPEQS